MATELNAETILKLTYAGYYNVYAARKNLKFSNAHLLMCKDNVNKNPTDATVCRYLFTAKLLYMFRVSQHPSSGVLKTVPAASGTGLITCTATPLPSRQRWRVVALQVI